jgi:hypothetical protein
MKKGLIVGACLAGVCVLIYVIMWFSYTRADVQLKNKAEAQQKVCEGHFDKMWKIIKQHAKVTDHYKDSFKEIYPALMEGRYGNARGGALMSWIKEDNPNLDAKVWIKMMNAIEAQRTSFFRDQEQLLDIKREHDNLRLQPPSKWFVGDSKEIEVVIITSAKTKEAYSSGEENDISLFEKKPAEAQ